MILYVENNMSGEEHNMINSNMINVFKKLYQSDINSIVCAKKHYESLNIDKTKLKLIEIKVFHPKYKISKYMAEIIHLIKIKKIINDNNYSILVFLSVSPVMHYFLRKFIKLIDQNIKIFVVCHGELMFLNSKSKTKFYKPEFWMRKAFLKKNDLIKYIILGEHIKIPFLMNENSILKVNHPNQSFKVTKSKISNKIRIGFIGVVSKSKGADNFIRIAKRFNNNDKFEFVFTGKVTEEYMYLKQSNIEGYYDNEFISKEKVDEKLKSLDLALFFYDNSYDYIASGALLDAINYEIPIYCMNSNIFKFLSIDKKLDFIKLFDDINKMIEAIDELNLDKMKDFNKIDFIKAKELFSINNAIEKLKKSNVK